MRTWLASGLARLARTLAPPRHRWDYYAEWPPSGKADGLAFHPAYGTKGNDVLPRLVFTVENRTIHIRRVWYDGRTDTIRIEITSGHFNGRLEIVQGGVVKEIQITNYRSPRQGGSSASISPPKEIRMEREIEDAFLPRGF